MEGIRLCQQAEMEGVHLCQQAGMEDVHPGWRAATEVDLRGRQSCTGDVRLARWTGPEVLQRGWWVCGERWDCVRLLRAQCVLMGQSLRLWGRYDAGCCRRRPQPAPWLVLLHHYLSRRAEYMLGRNDASP